MLLIKIFEWHGGGQEAIVYANNEVGNIAGTDRHQHTCIEVLKCIYIYKKIKNLKRSRDNNKK